MKSTTTKKALLLSLILSVSSMQAQGPQIEYGTGTWVAISAGGPTKVKHLLYLAKLARSDAREEMNNIGINFLRELENQGYAKGRKVFPGFKWAEGYGKKVEDP